MRSKKIVGKMKRPAAMILSAVLLAGTFSASSNVTVLADTNTVSLGEGSYSTVTKGQQVYSEEAGLVDRTTEQTWWPKRSVEGNVYVTDNMTGAIPTNDWATSFLWGTMYGGVTNPFSQPAYAYPLAYEASEEGMYLTKAPVHMVTQSTGAVDYAMPLQSGYIDLAIKPTGFTPTDCKVDKVTDWTYDVVEESGNMQMKTTMAQGSPYAYFQFENTDMEINFKRGTQMLLVSGSETDNVLVVKVLDNKENDWNYYAFFAPEGVTWSFTQNSVFITKITADFPEGSAYCSVANLPAENTDMLDLYEKYAYNYITDTKAEWSYDQKNSVLTTTYSIETENKAESTADGTIIGVLPHQYKNISDTASYLDYTYNTVRGTMKLLTGSGFETNLAYSGMLPFMPDVEDADQTQLSEYLDDYMEETKNNATPYLYIGEGSGDTYWTGKGLNKLVNVLAVAEELGETKKAATLLQALEGILEDWFSTSDSETDNYFYYDSEVGTLVGYPSSYGADTQLNDHHFHYGYWIYAAAQVALRDPEWASDNNWGAMVKELIGDIACTDRSGDRYPYLRNFSPYEGHSWASGHQLFADGNNQESSSEAINAWAGIILFGEATGDTDIRDLGIYLYTTEISAVDNYWFDLDKDVLSPQYRYRDTTATEYDPDREEIQVQASMVWGAKYVYATWWTDEPLQIQGINLLPITGSSFYLAKSKDYVLQNYETARKLEDSYTGSDKLTNPYDRWNDVWNEYLAMADPEQALENWSTTADEENGESRAHTYHYIKSLCKYGTPDESITSDQILSTAFEKDGVMSYSAFNPTDEPMTVNFSDGGCIIVKAHTLYTGLDGTNNLESGSDILVSDTPASSETPEASASESAEPIETSASTEPSVSESDTPSTTVVPTESSEPAVTSSASTNNIAIGDYGYLEATSQNNARIVFSKDTSWADVHYRVNNGTQMNYRMTKDGSAWYQDIAESLSEGDHISLFFTYYDSDILGAKDTETYEVTFTYSENAGVTSSAESSKEPEATESVAPTASTEASPSTSASANINPVVKVTTTGTSTIRQSYMITNTGTDAMDISKLKIRFYYAKEDTKEQAFTCDNAGLSLYENPWYVNYTSSVKASFGDGYVDLTFDQAYDLTEGYLTMETRFYNADWSGYTNFVAGETEVYYDGELCQ